MITVKQKGQFLVGAGSRKDGWEMRSSPLLEQKNKEAWMVMWTVNFKTGIQEDCAGKIEGMGREPQNMGQEHKNMGHANRKCRAHRTRSLGTWGRATRT